MVKKTIQETITLPEGVTAEIKGKEVTIKGPKGELTRTILARKIDVKNENGGITLIAENATQKEKKLLYTYRAHIRNMITGVTEGYTYKLKICSGHFPMSVAMKGNTLEVKNFIGEKVPRTLTIKEGVQVKINGDIIEVESINKELAGQTAGDIEKLTRRPGFDRRIFQDGIYIIEKAGKAV